MRPLPHWLYHRAQGNLKAALQDIQGYRQQEIIWDLVHVYGRLKQTANATRALGQMKKLDKRQAIDPFEFAWAYLGMGDKGLALTYLERALSEHSNQLITLKVEPAWDPLRSEPRFQEVLRRMGLADQKAETTIATRPPRVPGHVFVSR